MLSTKLIFEVEFDERAASEASARGYLSHVNVEVPSGLRFSVVFYDAVRLHQDLEDEAKSGTPFISAPGLIVLSEVTKENMQKATEKLFLEGYFEKFKPIP